MLAVGCGPLSRTLLSGHLRLLISGTMKAHLMRVSSPRICRSTADRLDSTWYSLLSLMRRATLPRQRCIQ
jgi:hypothetical protein